MSRKHGKRNKGVSNKKAWAKTMKQQPCHYCGVVPAGTIDHVVPFCEGGKTSPENCVPACDPCNQARKPGSQWTLAQKYSSTLSF